MVEDNRKAGFSQPESHDAPFVVGIGASAGGIGPLREFFTRVRPDGEMTYVVILHLSAQHESSLPELLQTRTSLPVTQVTHPTKIEPNHIYVIPPSKYLVMVDGMIRLTEPERAHGAHTSIDLFFRTLAEAYGPNSAAILLSGSGADGTIGLGRIKENGGFVIVQDPGEAEQPDMPRSAIEAGLVDLVLPVVEMPARLRALRDGARHLKFAVEKEVTPAERDETALHNLLTLLRIRTGNDFTHYRRPTLLRRISRRMQVREAHDLREYLEILHGHPDEVSLLLRDLLITVTNFFRDYEAFAALEAEVIPKLFADKKPDDRIRVWVPGCASGEEAYSIAMLLSEYAAKLSEPPSVQIFATDIDQHATALARECCYPATISVDVSPARLREFFVREGDHYQIKKQLREMVLFSPQNVLRDPPFSRLDLISCRNLLIYLNREMQERVLGIFHFALRADGYLFLGGSESADGVPSLFTPIDKKQRIYQRRTTVGSNQTSLNLLTGPWQSALSAREAANHESNIPAGRLHQEVLEQLAPPSVLIDSQYDIVHSSASAGRYMRVAGGEPSRNLLKLVLPEIQLELRSALLEAKSHGEGLAGVTRHLRVKIEGRERSLRLSARQVAAVPDAARDFFLVFFDETTESAPADAPKPGDNSGVEVVRQLEQELQHTRDQLRITVEQYETSTEELRASNEELQAINEELRSATEELETGKEELQSVNEELSTVNQEYREKIDEVSHANSDLQNLMSSIEIGTIFLDGGLRIKRYTPKAQQIFNVTTADVGRPLTHFTHTLNYPELNDDARKVLDTLHAAEREVVSTNGQWFLARLTPYRTIEDRIDGVVLTFVDITKNKQAEEQLAQRTAELKEQSEILKLGRVLVLDGKRRVLLWSAGCEQLYGYSSEDAIGKNAHNLLKTEFPAPRAEIDEALEASGQWQGELIHTTRYGKRIIVASHWILHQRRPDEPPVILEVNSDITALREAEEAASQADRNKDQFLATLAHELRNPLGAMVAGIELLRGDQDRVAVDILRRQLRHLTRIVDDLLDLERLTRGKIDLRRSHVTVSEIVKAALENMNPSLDQRKHTLDVSVPPEPIYLDADATRIAQVVSNLLDNALKYTPEGGLVALNVTSQDGKVVFSVRDTGIGISAKALPLLFNAYFQTPPRQGSELRGLGIGLSLVRKITEMHGGTVEASSEGLGKGSEFVVRLPLAGDQHGSTAPQRVEKSATSERKPVSRKILVVDDNGDSASALAMLLQRQGHETKIANDGPGALETAERFKPEVAILDIGLPHMDGYDLAKRMRAIVPNAMLIALSGWRLDPNDARVREARFDLYFTKPVEPEELSRVLANPKPRS